MVIVVRLHKLHIYLLVTSQMTVSYMIIQGRKTGCETEYSIANWQHIISISYDSISYDSIHTTIDIESKLNQYLSLQRSQLYLIPLKLFLNYIFCQTYNRPWKELKAKKPKSVFVVFSLLWTVGQWVWYLCFILVLLCFEDYILAIFSVDAED